jgi:ubiquinone/menaquinone biosynthesis C-methylase UbiE
MIGEGLMTRRESPLSIQSFYDSVAKKWARNGPELRDDFIGTPVVVKLAKALALNGTVLDCGCGDGNVARLVSPFARRVIGIDASSNMLDEAVKRSLRFENITYCRGKLERLPETVTPESVDLCLVLFSLCCVSSLKRLRRIFSNISAVLKPGKYVVVAIPHPVDSYLKKRSLWYRDLDAGGAYFDRGVRVRRKLRTARGDWLLVARYHFPLSDYFEAITSARLIVRRLLEPRPSSRVVRHHPTLRREAQFPSSMIFVCQRPPRGRRTGSSLGNDLKY